MGTVIGNSKQTPKRGIGVMMFLEREVCSGICFESSMAAWPEQSGLRVARRRFISGES